MIRLPLVLALLVAMVLDVGLPLLAARWALRRLRLNWEPFGYGGLTFAVAGVLILIPLVNWVTHAGAGWVRAQSDGGLALWALGLAILTAFVEQAGRYLGLRLLFTGPQRTWSRVVLFGLGYGAVQAVVLAALPSFVDLGNAVLLPQLNPYTLGLTLRETMDMLAAQREVATMETWRPLLGSLESTVLVALQTGLSVLVLQVFSRARRVWLLYAGTLHTAGQASLLLGTVYLQPWLGLLGLSAAAGLAGLWALRLRPQRRLSISA